MSKYGDLIKKVREIEPEDQETINPEDQKAINTEDQETINPEDQKAIKPETQKTKNPENHKPRRPETQKTINPEDQKFGLQEQELEQEQMVNLCVKVPISQRRYWMSKAKEQGITVTSVILEALKEKFGLPESQKTRKPNQ
ncbi:hypothetical protein H6G64_32525 [Calothrix sp. FACHB-156]|nr:hypothetical protein [Calothrix sp. FACHB-156]